MIDRNAWIIVVVLCLFIVSACGGQSNQGTKPALLANSLQLPQKSTGVAGPLNVARQPSQAASMAQPMNQSMPLPKDTPLPTALPTHAPASPTSVATNPPGYIAPGTIATTGLGAAPYGSPPQKSSEEIQLTQKLFALINSDRAARGLYAYTWNMTLSGGARLHSWNMFHCGFSHTCPDGTPQCDRIGAEGFAGYTDCGENIAYAGPFPTAWQGVYKIQEGMVNEPPSGWHRIHLFSTTLHRVGIGVFVDPQGYIWFTEDMVS